MIQNDLKDYDDFTEALLDWIEDECNNKSKEVQDATQEENIE